VGLLSLDWDGLQISAAAMVVLLAQILALACFFLVIEVIGIWIGRGKKDDQE
jgi:hypothetical protein